MIGAPITMVSLVNDRALSARTRDAAVRSAATAGINLETLVIDADAHGWSASRGLNDGLTRAAHRWVLCLHQDVVLPRDWFDRAAWQIQAWSRRFGRTPWVAGPVGVRRDGCFVGSVLDPNGFATWGTAPAPVVSLDEHALLIDRETGLRFDEALPGFHGYGTDIALRAREAGGDAIAIDAPAVHLSTGRLDEAYRQASAWLLDRWGETLDDVIPTPACTLVRRRSDNAWRRRAVTLRRRLAVRSRRLQQSIGGLPADRRAILVEAARDLPPAVRARLGAPLAAWIRDGAAGDGAADDAPHASRPTPTDPATNEAPGTAAHPARSD